MDVLRSKHPPGKPSCTGSLLYGPIEAIDPIIFDAIDGISICEAALTTTRTAGPSSVDAEGWRRLCVSFKSASIDLCEALAALARRLSKRRLEWDVDVCVMYRRAF